MVQAAYLHIPFCEQICHYCDFNKFFIQNQPVDQYVDSLIKEMEHEIGLESKAEFKTIFIGGGTPTALEESQLEKLLQGIKDFLLIHADKNLEFTVEANPGEVSAEKLKLMFDYGVNRLSFGVQAFQNSLLEKLGRSHRIEDVYSTVENAKKAGFQNISIDLMYGLPGQRKEDVKASLEAAFLLDVEHFSAYSLQVEPKTVFYNLQQKGKLILPQQEEEAEMYQIIHSEMNRNGFNRYEVSNFSKKGYESKHNLTYWNNEAYFGFGAGAHGYIKGRRTANAGPLKKYIDLVNEQGSGIIDSHAVTREEAMEEELFLGLRKVEGVSKLKFYQKFGSALSEVFGEQIKHHKRKGLLVEDENKIALTNEGFLLGNEVFQDFLFTNSLT